MLRTSQDCPHLHKHTANIPDILRPATTETGKKKLLVGNELESFKISTYFAGRVVRHFRSIEKHCKRSWREWQTSAAFCSSLIHHNTTGNNIHLNASSEKNRELRPDYCERTPNRPPQLKRGESRNCFVSLQIIYSNLILQIFQLTIAKAIKNNCLKFVEAEKHFLSPIGN